MELELFRVAVAVLGTAAAAAFDVFNNRNVPNQLLYAFVGLGLAANLWAFEPAFFLSALAPSLVILLFGWLLWREGQIGGADVLILAGLALLLPQPPTLFLERPAAPSSIPFIASIFMLSGAIFLVAFTLRSVPAVARAARRGEARVSGAGAAYALAALLLLWFFATTFAELGLPPAYLLLVVVVVGCSAFVLAFKETITDSLIELVPLNSIDEEDVLAVDKMDASIVKRWGLRKLLTADQLARLKKTRLKKFPVFKRLPTFLPWVLLALLLSLRYGDLPSILTALAFGQ